MCLDIRKHVQLFFIAMLVFLLTVVIQISVEAEKISVDDDGGADFITIQEAVENAADRDTVVVMEGVYNGTINVNSSISLIGSGSGGTVIDGNGTTYAMFISGNGVTIGGFSFINSKRGIGITSNNVYVHNNSFTMNNTYGIEITDAQELSIENCEFRTCKASGIGVTDSQDITIIGCDFQNNGYGVSYLRSADSSVEGSEFHNHSMGIYIQNSNDLRIKHNSFSNSTRAGIFVFGDHNDDIVIEDNTFDEFRYDVRIYGNDDGSLWGNAFVIASMFIIVGMVFAAAVIFINVRKKDPR